MRYHTLRFIDDGDVFVFVQHAERDIFRCYVVGNIIVPLHIDDIERFYGGRKFLRFAVYKDFDRAGFQFRAVHAAGKRGDVFVEPEAALEIGGNLYAERRHR